MHTLEDGAAPPPRGRRRHISRAEAEKLLPKDSDGVMDAYFPKRGATCGEEHVRNVLRGPYAFMHGCARRMVAQRGMISWSGIGLFAFGDRDSKHFGAGHTALLGQPGSGKTLLAKTAEEILQMDPKRIQGTIDLMPSDITGTSVLDIDENGKRYFKFVKGPIFAKYLIVDEITRISMRSQSAFLEAMSEGQVTWGGVTYQADPFIVATSNEEGVEKLLDALSDRLMFQVRVKPFTAADFTEILYRTQDFQRVNLAPVCDYKAVLEIRQFFHDTVHVSAEMRDFMGKLADTIGTIDGTGLLRHIREKLGFTANDPFLKPGSWPLSGRSITHLEGAARVLAAMRYRDYVTFADVYKVLLPIIRHRTHFMPNALSSGAREMLQYTDTGGQLHSELWDRFRGTGRTEMAEYLLSEIIAAAWAHVTPKE